MYVVENKYSIYLSTIYLYRSLDPTLSPANQGCLLCIAVSSASSSSNYSFRVYIGIAHAPPLRAMNTEIVGLVLRMVRLSLSARKTFGPAMHTTMYSLSARGTEVNGLHAPTVVCLFVCGVWSETRHQFLLLPADHDVTGTINTRAEVFSRHSIDVWFVAYQREARQVADILRWKETYHEWGMNDLNKKILAREHPNMAQ